MLWEKWRNMGKRKQGIWFTRYAYGHSIWQTQGIWPSCSLGRAGKPGASRLFMVSESFSLSMLPSTNPQDTCLSEQVSPLHFSPSVSQKLPPLLCLLSMGLLPSTPRTHPLLQILRSKDCLQTPSKDFSSSSWSPRVDGRKVHGLCTCCWT